MCVSTADNEGGTHEARRVHMDNLFKMVSYCDNQTDCRRTIILQHFGERFERSQCSLVENCECDNCELAGRRQFDQRDVTEEAKAIVECVVLLHSRGRDFTVNHFIDALATRKEEIKGAVSSSVARSTTLATVAAFQVILGTLLSQRRGTYLCSRSE